MRRRCLSPAGACAGGLFACFLALPAGGATLPPHRPLRLLIVSDFVNPHALPPHQLVEPGDLSAALLGAGTGLAVDSAADGVLEIPTNSIQQATALLSVPLSDPAAYDVLIYFAHRIPNDGPDGQVRQDAFTAAVGRYIEDGGGMVVYHHGAYDWVGKSDILDLIGATAAGAVPWNTTEGQNVIAVAPAHFVTANGLTYSGSVSYADPGRGVPPAAYPYFNNLPDERYPSFEINPTAGAIEVLFASDYDDGGTTHLLGFTHRRPTWCGDVVAYQPGEYQPNMLDPAGRNFQVIANEIVWAARARTDDDVLLLAAKRAAGEVALAWTGGAPCYTLWRSSDVTAVIGKGGRLADTAATAYQDAPPAGPIWSFRITSR